MIFEHAKHISMYVVPKKMFSMFSIISGANPSELIETIEAIYHHN